MNQQIDKTICLKIFKALSDANRLDILDLLKDGEKCACVLLEQLHLTQSGLSYHMKILCESQIVTSRQKGKWTYYSLNKESGQKIIELLQQLTCLDINHHDLES